MPNGVSLTAVSDVKTADWRPVENRMHGSEVGEVTLPDPYSISPDMPWCCHAWIGKGS